MKTGRRRGRGWWAVWALLLPAMSARGDIVDKQVVVGDRVISVPVLDPGGRTKKLDSVIGFRVPPPPAISVVPGLETRMVHPALETEETRPRPRFGYGSDWDPEGGTDSTRETPRNEPDPPRTAEPGAIPPLAPVIQFHHSYRPRAYWSAWSALPYIRYHGGDCRPFAYPWFSSHRSWSGTSVSIRAPGFSFWFSR